MTKYSMKNINRIMDGSINNLRSTIGLQLVSAVYTSVWGKVSYKSHEVVQVNINILLSKTKTNIHGTIAEISKR